MRAITRCLMPLHYSRPRVRTYSTEASQGRWVEVPPHRPLVGIKAHKVVGYVGSYGKGWACASTTTAVLRRCAELSSSVAGQVCTYRCGIEHRYSRLPEMFRDLPCSTEKLKTAAKFTRQILQALLPCG